MLNLFGVNKQAQTSKETSLLKSGEVFISNLSLAIENRRCYSSLEKKNGYKENKIGKIENIHYKIEKKRYKDQEIRES